MAKTTDPMQKKHLCSYIRSRNFPYRKDQTFEGKFTMDINQWTWDMLAYLDNLTFKFCV